MNELLAVMGCGTLSGMAPVWVRCFYELDTVGGLEVLLVAPVLLVVWILCDSCCVVGSRVFSSEEPRGGTSELPILTATVVQGLSGGCSI